MTQERLERARFNLARWLVMLPRTSLLGTPALARRAGMMVRLTPTGVDVSGRFYYRIMTFIAPSDASHRQLKLRREPGSQGADPVWQRVRWLAESAAHDGRVVAVIVFGSLARDEQLSASDVDLVVVVEDMADLADIRGRFRRASDVSGKIVTPILFTVETLAREAGRRPTFAAHLVDEGVVIFETEAFGEVEAALVSAGRASRQQIDDELIERSAVLDRLSELRRFNGEFVPTLSQLYSLSRSVVIARLLQEGEPEYSWRRMFDVLSARRPDLAGHLTRLRDLRPYFEHVHGRSRLSDEALRVDPAEVEAAIQSVRKVAEVTAHG